MTKAVLDRLLAESRHHLAPFLVLGDPTPPISLALARAAVAAGATMLELGVPYSDPCADGVAIQAADERALAAGTSTPGALALLAQVHAACPGVALNLLVYGNLVHAWGWQRFCAAAAGAGASSLLVPDVPLEEAAPLRRACRDARLAHVLMVGPLTDADRLRRLDAAAGGFLYLAARQGVTGVRDAGLEPVLDLVGRTAAAIRHPLALGFGLADREQVRAVFVAGARIAVVGSLLARAIGAAWDRSPGDAGAVVDRFTATLEPLLAASRTGEPTCS